MSKNLEKEYREFTKRDVPDLWERINSGLEEKGTASEAGGSGQPADFKLITCDMNKRKAEKAGKCRQKRYRMWGMAAACLCLAVTGFGLRGLLLPGRELSSEGIAGDKLSGSAMNGKAENVNAPADRNDWEAVDGKEAMEADNCEMAEVDSSMGSIAKPNSVLEMPREDAATAGEPEAGGDSGVIMLQIEITSVINKEDQVVYEAEVRTSEDLSLQGGDKITLYDGRSEGRTLEKGETCEVYAVEATDSGEEKTYRIIDMK